VDVLGYARAALELATAPGETLKKSVALERLPVAELTARAEAAFRARAYEDVLTLCGCLRGGRERARGEPAGGDGVRGAVGIR
jgi:hypothetical protein